MLNYTIIDDSICELNEIFKLTIDTSSLLNGVFVDDPYQATITILDEDREL